MSSRTQENASSLAEVFRAHLGELGHQISQGPTEERLGKLLNQCRKAWPEIEIDDSRFLQALAERLPKGEAADIDASLEKMHASDLYLACACADEDAIALTAFERQFLAGTAAVIAGIDSSPAFIQEVQQKLRQKLFLPDDSQAPRIQSYTAQGSLKQWLRSAALRTALNLREGAGRLVSYDEDANPLLVPSDPELDLMKGQYREDFKVALQAAMAGLSARDRTVLRLHWVDGLNIDKIGAVYRVHRSTVARWIAQCRKQLLEDTKRALKARLQVSHSELHSLVGLLRSQLHLSVSRVLQEEH